MNKTHKKINLDEKDRKAEMAVLVKMEDLTSQGAKRDFAEEIGLPWEEYLRIKRKWKRVLERYKKEKPKALHEQKEGLNE
jgi:hypothetical protein